jgi:hypothetical protein
MTNEYALAEYILRALGIAGTPTLVIIALYRGYIVLGRHYVELAKERDFWRTVALKGLNAAEMATTLAERQTAGE